jgi:hypothetical protein
MEVLLASTVREAFMASTIDGRAGAVKAGGASATAEDIISAGSLFNALDLGSMVTAG